MMRPAMGIGWLLWRQNRVGLIGLMVYLVAILGGIRLLSGNTLGPDQIQISAAVFLCYSLLFLAGMGSMNLMSDRPDFKPYLFVLPVKTRSLVLWHMVYPILAAMIVWLIGAELLIVPSAGYQVLLWPTALIVLMISIWQATLWYPAAWYLRPVFIVLGMAGPAFLLAQAWIRDMPIETISFCLLPVVPISVAVAIRGVEIGRSGQAKKGIPVLTETGLACEAIDGGLERFEKKAKPPFHSARLAQLWLEWRTNGIILPVMVAVIYVIMIPIAAAIACAIASGFSVGDLGVGHIRTYTAFRCGFVVIPATAFLLLSAGASVYQGTLRREGDLEPFFAARPMTTWDLFVSKVGAVTQSALGTWVVTLFFTGLWLLMPATDGKRSGTIGGLLLAYGPPKAAWYAVALLLVLILWTWRSQVCSLFLGLSGRKWLGWVAVGLFILQSSVAAYLKFHPTLAREVARLIPDPVIALAVLKPILAAVVFYFLRRKNLVGLSTLGKVAGVWLLAACALSAFLIWLLPPTLAPEKSIVSGVVLLLPLVRPLLAPIALDWNRHR